MGDIAPTIHDAMKFCCLCSTHILSLLSRPILLILPLDFALLCPSVFNFQFLFSCFCFIQQSRICTVISAHIIYQHFLMIHLTLFMVYVFILRHFFVAHLSILSVPSHGALGYVLTRVDVVTSSAITGVSASF